MSVALRSWLESHPKAERLAPAALRRAWRRMPACDRRLEAMAEAAAAELVRGFRCLWFLETQRRRRAGDVLGADLLAEAQGASCFVQAARVVLRRDIDPFQMMDKAIADLRALKAEGATAPPI